MSLRVLSELFKKWSPVPAQPGEDLVPSAGFLINPSRGHTLVSKDSGVHNFVDATRMDLQMSEGH